MARTVDGARRIVDLRNGAVAPVKRPAFACRWCRLLADCTEGQDHLRSANDLDDLDRPDERRRLAAIRIPTERDPRPMPEADRARNRAG